MLHWEEAQNETKSGRQKAHSAGKSSSHYRFDAHTYVGNSYIQYKE